MQERLGAAANDLLISQRSSVDAVLRILEGEIREFASHERRNSLHRPTWEAANTGGTGQQGDSAKIPIWEESDPGIGEQSEQPLDLPLRLLG